jgi:hypothetical protein
MEAEMVHNQLMAKWAIEGLDGGKTGTTIGNSPTAPNVLGTSSSNTPLFK